MNAAIWAWMAAGKHLSGNIQQVVVCRWTRRRRSARRALGGAVYERAEASAIAAVRPTAW